MSRVQIPLPDFIEQLQDDPLVELEWRRGLFGKMRDETVRRDGGGGRYNYRLRPEQRVKNAQKIPQAVVKIIPGGGCSGRGQLTAQLNYLSRDGDLELEEGYREFRNPIWDTDDIRDTAIRWAMDWEDAMSRDGRTARAKNKTFHMLISYPEGTDPETAKDAADKFADLLCHSGEFGDEWRNVRAWHTDRAHPHMHLVIDRLGESGRMMQIHPAKDINPKRLRALQVDTAAEYGLALNDTPRVSRGHREQGFSSHEHRLKERGQWMDRSYSRQQYAMVVEGYAELSINQEIKELKALAQEYRDTAPVSRHRDAVALEDAAKTLADGGTLTAPSLREQEMEQQQEREHAKQREEELQQERQQEHDRNEVSLQDDWPYRIGSMSVEEIEGELMGGPVRRPEPAEEREQSIWDQLDQIGRGTESETGPDQDRESRTMRRKSLLTDRKFSISAEPEVQSEKPVAEDRKPTFEEFMAKLEADEREMIANERKRAKALLDGIEAKQERDPNFVPNGNAFAQEIEKQSIELNSDERYRARQLGIEHECVEQRGLSRGF